MSSDQPTGSLSDDMSGYITPGYDVEVAPDVSFYGPPGTGKTTALMEVVESEIESGTDPLNICGSTYRKKMAAEFRERASETVGRDVDEGWYRTTHAICYRLLDLRQEDVMADEEINEFCRSTGWPAPGHVGGDVEEDSPWVSLGGGNSDLTEGLLAVHSYCRNMGLDTTSYWNYAPISSDQREEISRRAVEEFVREYEQYKQDHDLYDFDDMLEVVVRQERAPPVEVLIEDEFQDKTPLQIEVYNTWAEQIPQVYVAGDPAQAIYTFTGTRPKFMRKAHEMASDGRLLDQSYRFGQDLADEAFRLLRRGGHDAPDIEALGETDICRMSWADFERDIRNQRGEDTGHLVRANYLSSAVAAALSSNGIPFRSRAATWTPKQLDLYNGVVRLVTQVEGLDALERPDFGEMDPGELQRVVGAMPASHLRMTRNELSDRIENGDLRDPLAAMTLEGITECLSGNPFDVESRDDSTLLPSGIGSDGVQSRLRSAFQGRGPEPIEEINHDISTIHGAKGQEWDTVYLYNATTKTIHEEGSDMEESLVWYVGLTRAIDRLVLVDDHPQAKYTPGVIR